MAENIIIRASFELLCDRSELGDWETRGVYINLGGDPVRTSRVGEGWVHQRAAAAWTRRDDRLIACDLGTVRTSKRDAEILEWLILSEYEQRMGRLPRRNVNHGKSTVVMRSLQRRDKVRVQIRGRSPLNGRRTSSAILSVIEIDDDGNLNWTWG